MRSPLWETGGCCFQNIWVCREHLFYRGNAPSQIVSIPVMYLPRIDENRYANHEFFVKSEVFISDIRELLLYDNSACDESY